MNSPSARRGKKKTLTTIGFFTVWVAFPCLAFALGYFLVGPVYGGNVAKSILQLREPVVMKIEPKDPPKATNRPLVETNAHKKWSNPN